MDEQLYDLIIIGGGSAGLAAGIYGARGGLTTLLLEKAVIGGQAATADIVDNYPGFSMIQGPDLMERMEEHAARLGVTIRTAAVESLQPVDHYRQVVTDEGTFVGKAVIVATGSDPRKLGVPGEKEFMGRGVSYCAICDGTFFKGVPVAVVGGGDAAVTEGLYLTGLASKVTIIHRRHELRAAPLYQDRAFANPKVEFLKPAIVEQILGQEKVEGLLIRDLEKDKQFTLPVEGVFIYIGHLSNTDFLKGAVDLDPLGYVITNEWMETSLAGVFAAGDVRSGSVKQIVVACGEGCIAALRAFEYIEGLKEALVEERQ